MPDAPPSRPTASPLLEAIAALADRRSLTESQTTAVFATVMQGAATPAQIAALLMGLRTKGETADEVAGAARALREAMVPVQAAGDHLVDTCGTGGGTVPTFNISTAAAFVAAGAGASVAKHGNRSFTSRCGSADVLEAPGGQVSTWELDPASYGLAIADAAALRGGEPAANAARIERLLGAGGSTGDEPGRAALLLNAAAALYVAGIAPSYEDGLARARGAIGAGRAHAALERLRRAAAPRTSG